ncbi:putative transposase [Candidatus Nitrososphaera gargensis Ga9.2]|uniref:Putative transposase n=1 Tax=Nitrososphaera gargensis (strain Ga9.2) TaxID=1237085 RepID=K0IF26_NITGG|nr:transposase [Candidatus Nitrososphaera gargensis]AFU58380.1 putative transposase [Candidatus Nitrososphaera gargensis Ga9.2]
MDQWYAGITTDDGVEKAAVKVDVTKPVGIDVGLLNWLTLSDGKVILNTLDFGARINKIKQL